MEAVPARPERSHLHAELERPEADGALFAAVGLAVEGHDDKRPHRQPQRLLPPTSLGPFDQEQRAGTTATQEAKMTAKDGQKPRPDMGVLLSEGTKEPTCSVAGYDIAAAAVRHRRR